MSVCRFSQCDDSVAHCGDRCPCQRTGVDKTCYFTFYMLVKVAGEKRFKAAIAQVRAMSALGRFSVTLPCMPKSCLHGRLLIFDVHRARY